MWDNIKKIESSNENVSKFVFTCATGVAEAVLYKYPTYIDRTVICCSTQSGCPVGCRFCGAGDHFVRSLTVNEIISQPVHLLEQIEKTDINPAKIKKLQIMFMSMGEIFLNYKNVSEAIKQLYKLYPNARLLISTSAPRNFSAFSQFRVLSQEIPTIGLQFSVHESTDEARKKLIPTPTMTLWEIAVEGIKWNKATGRKPFFNYCVHDKNNTNKDVDNLCYYFNPNVWEATLSVICERDEYLFQLSPLKRQLAEDFSEKLLKVGYSTRVFDPAGQDTANGCGQLWETQKWMNQHSKLIQATKGCNKEKVHAPI